MQTIYKWEEFQTISVLKQLKSLKKVKMSLAITILANEKMVWDETINSMRILELKWVGPSFSLIPMVATGLQ